MVISVETIDLSKGQAEVVIDSCRPIKKDRVVFCELVPYDTYWHTGENEPTIIEFSREVTFGDKLVDTGSYWLYAVLGKLRMNSRT